MWRFVDDFIIISLTFPHLNIKITFNLTYFFQRLSSLLFYFILFLSLSTLQILLP